MKQEQTHRHREQAGGCHREGELERDGLRVQDQQIQTSYQYIKGGFNRHEFEQTLGDNERQGSLVNCSPWGHKESDITQLLNNNSQTQQEPGKLSSSSDSASNYPYDHGQVTYQYSQVVFVVCKMSKTNQIIIWFSNFSAYRDHIESSSNCRYLCHLSRDYNLSDLQ